MAADDTQNVRLDVAQMLQNGCPRRIRVALLQGLQYGQMLARVGLDPVEGLADLK